MAQGQRRPPHAARTEEPEQHGEIDMHHQRHREQPAEYRQLRRARRNEDDGKDAGNRQRRNAQP